MDKSTKNALIIIGSLLLLCACTATALIFTGLWSFGNVVKWADNSTSENPQEVVRFGSEIADFDVPEEFGSPYGIHFGDVKSVGYVSESGNTHIILTQFPEGTSVNVEEMLRLMEEGSGDPNSIWYNTETTLIEQKPVIIRGEETTLSISDGTSNEGIRYRMANAIFQGRGTGPSLLLFVGPADEWDAKLLEDFIASIQ
jgi:hypothetical protein